MRAGFGFDKRRAFEKAARSGRNAFMRIAFLASSRGKRFSLFPWRGLGAGSLEAIDAPFRYRRALEPT